MNRNAALRARLQHLLSYLAISMVPVLLCGVLLIQSSYGQSAREIEQTAYVGLGLLKNSYEYLLQSVDISVSHFHANGALTHAAPEDIAAQLAVYKANYPDFSDIIYYAKGSAEIIDADMAKPYAAFQQSLPGDVNLDRSSMFVNLNGVTSPMILRVRSNRPDKLGGDYLAFLQPVPVLSANPEGVLAFFLPVQHLASQVDDCVGQPYDLYVLATQHLSYLYRSDEKADKLEDRLYKLRGTGVFHEQVDGKDYVFMRVISERHQVYHLIALPAETLFAPALAERGRMMLLLGGLLALTALAAFALHSYIYRPIRAMIEEPLPQSGADESVRNIYAHVRSRMRDVAVQNGRLSEQIEDTRLLMRQQTLHNLICGYVDRGGAAHLASAGMEEQAAWYTVAYVILYLEDEGRHELMDGDVWTMPEGKGYVIGLKETERIAVLLNHAGGEAQRTALAERVVGRIAHKGLTVQCMGMGTACSRMEDIALSFLQAQAVLRQADQTRKIYLFEPAQPGRMHAPFLPMSDKLLLCECIRKGQTDIALSTLEKMCADVGSLNHVPTVTRSWCFFIYDAVLGVFEELGLSELVKRMPNLMAFGEAGALIRELSPLVGQACECVQREEKQQKKDLQDSILQFVHEHFHEQEMSLEYLGSVFQLSESFLTRFFRKKTGQSFLQYISELRMDKVKRLLEETDQPIREIIAQTGYVDAANFTRKFRQQEGCTPGSWRQARRLESESLGQATD